MENVNRLMQIAFAAIVFCIGLTILIFKTKIYHSLLEEEKELLKEEVIYQQYNSDHSNIVSDSYLIAALMQPLDYDVMIDTTVVRKTEHSTDKISSYGIQDTDYIKSYQYNDNGEIIMILYTHAN